jgi:predicted transcriptional regulator
MTTPRQAATVLTPPSQLIDELIANGLTQSEIARLTGIPQPSVSRMLNGRSCNLSSYQALVALHRDQFSAANRARRARRERKEREAQKALEDRIRAEVIAQLSADEKVPETATE